MKLILCNMLVLSWCSGIVVWYIGLSVSVFWHCVVFFQVCHCYSHNNYCEKSFFILDILLCFIVL